MGGEASEEGEDIENGTQHIRHPAYPRLDECKRQGGFPITPHVIGSTGNMAKKAQTLYDDPQDLFRRAASLQ